MPTMAGSPAEWRTHDALVEGQRRLPRPSFCDTLQKGGRLAAGLCCDPNSAVHRDKVVFHPQHSSDFEVSSEWPLAELRRALAEPLGCALWQVFHAVCWGGPRCPVHQGKRCFNRHPSGCHRGLADLTYEVLLAEETRRLGGTKQPKPAASLCVLAASGSLQLTDAAPPVQPAAERPEHSFGSPVGTMSGEFSALSVSSSAVDMPAATEQARITTASAAALRRAELTADVVCRPLFSALRRCCQSTAAPSTCASTSRRPSPQMSWTQQPRRAWWTAQLAGWPTTSAAATCSTTAWWCSSCWLTARAPSSCRWCPASRRPASWPPWASQWPASYLTGTAACCAAHGHIRRWLKGTGMLQAPCVAGCLRVGVLAALARTLIGALHELRARCSTEGEMLYM